MSLCTICGKPVKKAGATHHVSCGSSLSPGMYEYRPTIPGGDWRLQESDYVQVLTGATRDMREDGVGEKEPHVQVWTGYSKQWYPVRRLRRLRDQDQDVDPSDGERLRANSSKRPITDTSTLGLFLYGSQEALDMWWAGNTAEGISHHAKGSSPKDRGMIAVCELILGSDKIAEREARAHGMSREEASRFVESKIKQLAIGPKRGR